MKAFFKNYTQYSELYDTFSTIKSDVYTDLNRHVYEGLNKLQLAGVIIQPIQRGPRYALLVKEIEKDTAQESAKHYSHNERIVFGTIADGDFLPNPAWQLKLLGKNNVQAIAMDGVPVTKLGWIFNTPTLVLHSIANIAGEEIIDSNTELAAENTGKYIVKIIENLPKSNFHI